MGVLGRRSSHGLCDPPQLRLQGREIGNNGRMHRTRAALTVLLTVAIATGCGSEDAPKQAGGSDEPETEAAQTAKPKPTSARAKLVTCLEDEGYDVTHEDQPAATATRYTVKSSGRAKAVIKIHSNRDEARGSAARAGEDRGQNAVPFGRAEFLPDDAATDTDNGVVANCVSRVYG